MTSNKELFPWCTRVSFIKTLDENLAKEKERGEEREKRGEGRSLLMKFGRVTKGVQLNI